MSDKWQVMSAKKNSEVRTHYNLDRRGFLTPSWRDKNVPPIGLFTIHSSLFTQRGFTLLELIIVVSILSIFAALALPTFNNAFSDYKIESAAKRIASDIRYARSYAITTDDTISITFDPADENYQVKNSSNIKITHPFLKTNFQITMTKNFDLENIDLYQTTLPGPGNKLIFDSLGATQGGTIEIRYAGRVKIITVSAIDGDAYVS